MLISKVSFSSDRSVNATSTKCCQSYPKQQITNFASGDRYTNNLEKENEFLRKALRLACKIIAINE